MLGQSGLGQHDPVGLLGHDGVQIVLPEIIVQRIDSHNDLAAGEIQILDGVADENAGRILFVGRNGVLQIEDHGVSAQIAAVDQDVGRVAR